jgi:hypothetical protein
MGTLYTAILQTLPSCRRPDNVTRPVTPVHNGAGGRTALSTSLQQ